MKTKIVYVVCSNENDYYLEQTMISVASVRKYSDDVQMYIVVDENTKEVIDQTRPWIKRKVNGIIPVKTPDGFNNVQKSRFIKTSLRNIIKGDYLFIDSDTVICSKLDDIDNLNYSVAAVKDKHLNISQHNWKNLIQEWAQSVGWQLSEKDDIYYNSGVFFVKDDEVAHHLYTYWHKYWLESNSHGLSIDQPALGKANADCGYVIKELPGIWNCQVLENGLKYLSDAKIIHFFSSTLDNKGANSPYLLKDVRLYEKIRNSESFPPDILELIEHPKQAFKSKTVLLTDDEIELMSTPLYQKLKQIYLQTPSKFSRLEKLRGCLGSITRKLHIR